MMFMKPSEFKIYKVFVKMVLLRRKKHQSFMFGDLKTDAPHSDAHGVRLSY